MKAPIKQIETPKGKQKVDIKEWITGREREYIEGAMLSGVNAKPRVAGKDTNIEIDKMNMESLIQETNHRAIKSFVVSIDGNSEDVVTQVLDMHEVDTAFILKAIDEISKKKDLE